MERFQSLAPYGEEASKVDRISVSHLASTYWPTINKISLLDLYNDPTGLDSLLKHQRKRWETGEGNP